MRDNEPKRWLLLIHQIPPKPSALRVRIWRRLQRVGAVAIKQSVYALPHSEQSREDLSWILKEIIEGGGDGSISEARFLEGLTDEQLIAFFQNARRSDYEKIILEARLLLSEWSSGGNSPSDTAAKGHAQLYKLRQQMDEVSTIDFFQVEERRTVEILLEELGSMVSRQPLVGQAVEERLENLKGKTWVTRKSLFVDRLACGWLIRRFVDKEAVFKFVTVHRYSSKPDEIRFDMFEGEYTHEGDRCTFETMIQRLQLQDRAFSSMAEMVHDIDLKDAKYNREETIGFNALLTGMVASHQDDNERMEEGIRLFENLFAYFRRLKGE